MSRITHSQSARCRRCTLLAVIATALLLGRCVAALELETCRITANEGRAEVKALCGTLAVPLDPSAPEGERIELFVAVVPALAEEPAPDPFVVIAGGPGDASTRFFVQSQAAFTRILRQRDVLLVDQRGSGKSAPLHCANLAELGLGDGAGSDVDELVRLTLDCAKTLQHDPRFFTTSVAVQDLDLVREALGYQQLNLYGISYGTRVAQHYLRRFPEHVRSAVLDGVLPPTLALGPEVTLDSQAALDALFSRCREDAACHAAYPELAAHFNAVYERLRQESIEVTFDDPRSGESTTARIDHMVMAGVIRQLLYSPLSATLLPPLVEAAYRGDYRKLAAQAQVVVAAVQELAIGLNYAVLCAEDEPFWSDVDLAAQAATYLGSTFIEAAQGVCSGWPRGVMDDDLKQAVASDVPVLLLSGELDPITPPRYATLAAERLGNALALVGAGQGHGMLAVACVQRLMADFVDSADTQALDSSCLERVRPFPLFSSPMGPGP